MSDQKPVSRPPALPSKPTPSSGTTHFDKGSSPPPPSKSPPPPSPTQKK